MLKHKAVKTISLPVSLCKTDIISIGTNDYSNDVRYRSISWHGIEDTIASVDTPQAVGSVHRKTGRDHQDKWEARIKMITEEALSDKLKDVDYHHDDCKQLCTSISKIVHDKLKSVTDFEFKIIVLSFIGELQGEGIEAATQCSWEPQKDIMVTAYFKNETLFALTNIFLTRVSETLV